MNTEQSPFPMPVPGGEGKWRLRLVKLLKWPVLLVVLTISIENLFGHPAIRWQWMSHGSNDPRDMNMCECVTVFGESHYFLGYRSLVTFVREPRLTLSGWAWDKVSGFFPG